MSWDKVQNNVNRQFCLYFCTTDLTWKLGIVRKNNIHILNEPFTLIGKKDKPKSCIFKNFMETIVLETQGNFKQGDDILYEGLPYIVIEQLNNNTYLIGK